jgi:hypothetical protein
VEVRHVEEATKYVAGGALQSHREVA